MSRVLGFAIVCVVLAVAQALTAALCIALLLCGLIAAIRHPRETVGFLAALGLLALVSAQPVLCMVGVTVVAAVRATVSWRANR
ncbi:MAG: hypothetical protein K1X67_12295 [Fimbriimonadaceae bacterium]|nr:hypothetical protein [Fimbriimonadaceae bacterium]